MDHARLISVDPGPSRVPSWPKLRWKFTRTCRCTPISFFFLTYRCICDVFTRSNSVRNSRCYCYEDTNLGGEKMWCFHEGKFSSIFTMPLLCWHKFGWEKIHNAFTRCPWDLSLLGGLRPRAGWGCPTLIWSLFNSTKAQGTILNLHGPRNWPCRVNISRSW